MLDFMMVPKAVVGYKHARWLWACAAAIWAACKSNANRESSDMGFGISMPERVGTLLSNPTAKMRNAMVVDIHSSGNNRSGDRGSVAAAQRAGTGSEECRWLSERA
jgi:hypothetical protein